MLFPSLQAKLLQTKTDQVKYHIGELRNVLGTAVRRTKKINIPHSYETLYHELRSWPSRRRNVAQTFYERRSTQVKRKKIPLLDRSSTKDACSLVCKILWWFENDRLVISRRSDWRNRIRFLNESEEYLATNDICSKPRLFKPFYAFCDISQVCLEETKKPKTKGKKLYEVERLSAERQRTSA